MSGQRAYFRAICALFLVVILFSQAGCASLQKKFTRKKPETRASAVIYTDTGPYQKKFSNDYYYKMHYTLWKSWQGEILTQLGGNRKKVARSAQEATNHLDQLSHYLLPEKKEELKPWLDSLASITKKLEAGDTPRSEEHEIRAELEKIKRVVSNNFYYEKVKENLIQDSVDLGSSSAASVP